MSYGLVRDMMERYAQNRQLLLNKRQRHDRTKNAQKKGAYKLHKTDKDGAPLFIDKKVLKEIKARLRREKRLERWAFTSLALIALAVAVWIFAG
ncbi:MAG: hypothetical protein ABR574_07805 [Cryomorphaceae bacterium]|nr:hypothetical protein [Flavobacteriales bacterium]